MKRILFSLATVLTLLTTSCNDGGDNNLYFQAQMVSHISNVAATPDDPGKMRADAVVYEVIIDTKNMKADLACNVILPDGKAGTVDVRGMALSIDSKTGGYYIKQTGDSRSQGSFAVTNLAGVLDLNQSGVSKSRFSFIVEKHYQVNATLVDLGFESAKAVITDEGTGTSRTISGCDFVFNINPVNGMSTVSITGLDYDGNIGKTRTLVYDNLEFKPCYNGYEITGDLLSPKNDGEATLAKYKLKKFKATLQFLNGFEASYSIDGIGDVKVAQ
ncbi:MAG: hypothetical protein MJZ63_08085 [Muribaculaceae bacterium]|nr:hypothetical protein [Muribaculaceae bacterium]